MKGNIRCLSRPDYPVLGFVEVSTITTAERFIPESAGLYEPTSRRCALQVVHRMAKNDMSDTIFEFAQEQGQGPEPDLVVGTPMSYGPHACLDCTSRGSKNKPPFWPTYHL